MRGHEIARLSLDAELVVLAGCQSVRGKEIRGEGVWSLSSAFFSAGAARVIGTLWPVHDEAASSFFESFYEHLLVEKEHPAKALKMAQCDMQRSRWKAPVFWAGFILQGTWPSSISYENRSPRLLR